MGGLFFAALPVDEDEIAAYQESLAIAKPKPSSKPRRFQPTWRDTYDAGETQLIVKRGAPARKTFTLAEYSQV
jgi:hypothetical protein